MHAADPRRGYLLGLSAYVIWGLFPLYFKLLAAVPAPQILVHRVLWSALCGLLLLQFWRHPGWWRELREHPRRLAVLAGSGLLIASNWLLYVWAVNNGRMLEASLGYYINPLLNVLLGLLLLGERLRPLQWLAVGCAALGVLQQVWQAGSLPWVSLVLPLTFGFYGLIRKKAPPVICPTPPSGSCSTSRRPWCCCWRCSSTASPWKRTGCWPSCASGSAWRSTVWISG